MTSASSTRCGASTRHSPNRPRNVELGVARDRVLHHATVAREELGAWYVLVDRMSVQLGPANWQKKQHNQFRFGRTRKLQQLTRSRSTVEVRDRTALWHMHLGAVLILGPSADKLAIDIDTV